MRTIELSTKKRMKRINLTVLLLSGVCLLCQPLQAQQSIDACDGRTYKVGDTLRIGEPLPSGYLFIKQINADNKFDKLNPKNSTGRTAVITDIPAYQPKLYQQFGIYQQPETPQIVFAEQGDFKIGVYLNMALTKGNIMSGHHVSHMDGAVDLPRLSCSPTHINFTANLSTQHQSRPMPLSLLPNSMQKQPMTRLHWKNFVQHIGKNWNKLWQMQISIRFSVSNVCRNSKCTTSINSVSRFRA